MKKNETEAKMNLQKRIKDAFVYEPIIFAFVHDNPQDSIATNRSSVSFMLTFFVILLLSNLINIDEML